MFELEYNHDGNNNNNKEYDIRKGKLVASTFVGFGRETHNRNHHVNQQRQLVYGPWVGPENDAYEPSEARGSAKQRQAIDRGMHLIASYSLNVHHLYPTSANFCLVLTPSALETQRELL